MEKAMGNNEKLAGNTQPSPGSNLTHLHKLLNESTDWSAKEKAAVVDKMLDLEASEEGLGLKQFDELISTTDDFSRINMELDHARLGQSKYAQMTKLGEEDAFDKMVAKLRQAKAAGETIEGSKGPKQGVELDGKNHTHIFKPGENLYDVALSHGATVSAVQNANPADLQERMNSWQEGDDPIEIIIP